MHRASVLLVAAMAWLSVAAAHKHHHKRIVVKQGDNQDDSETRYSGPLEPTEEARDILDKALAINNLPTQVCVDQFYWYSTELVRGVLYYFHVSGKEIAPGSECAGDFPRRPPNFTVEVYRDYLDHHKYTVNDISKD